jgi:hypothetical protein
MLVFVLYNRVLRFIDFNISYLTFWHRNYLFFLAHSVYKM